MSDNPYLYKKVTFKIETSPGIAVTSTVWRPTMITRSSSRPGFWGWLGRLLNIERLKYIAVVENAVISAEDINRYHRNDALE